MDTTLILFTGLPGTGKSTLARLTATRLHAPLLSPDYLMDFAIPRHMLECAEPFWDDLYGIMFSLADAQLALRISVVLDGMFREQGRTMAQRLAARRNARFRAIHTHCSDEAIWRERVQRRMETALPNETPASWEGVQQSRESYQPWNRTDALFVDTVNGLDENMASVLDYLLSPDLR